MAKEILGGRFRIVMVDAKGEFDMANQKTHEQGWNGALDKLGRLLQE